MRLIDNHLQKRLDALSDKNQLRTLKVSQHGLSDFTSNDYLGLARSEELFQTISMKHQQLPHLNGSGGSRLLSGNTAYAVQLEQRLAKLFNGEACLLFNSGYTANLGVISTIPQRGDTILYDEFAHACIKDGARLSLAKRFPFKHNDLKDLKDKIKRSDGMVYIVVESVYSMDGDFCPLADLVELANAHGATIIVDEAHSTGVYGHDGSGLTNQLGLSEHIPVRIFTFGKGMGVHGACVVSSTPVINYLTNCSRPLVYSTAMPLHALTSISCAFDFIAEHPTLQEDLSQRINLFKDLCKAITPSNTAIQPVIIPGNNQVKTAASRIQKAGFDVRPVISPTVRAGSERLRICLHTFNTTSEIKALCYELNDLDCW